MTPKQPKTRVNYINLLTLPNIVHPLPCQVIDMICHYVTVMILTPLTMLTTINASHAITVAHLANHEVILTA